MHIDYGSDMAKKKGIHIECYIKNECGVMMCSYSQLLTQQYFIYYRIVESFEQMGANLIQNDDFIEETTVSTSLAFRGEKISIQTLQTTGRTFSVAMDKNGEIINPVILLLI